MPASTSASLVGQVEIRDDNFGTFLQISAGDLLALAARGAGLDCYFTYETPASLLSIVGADPAVPRLFIVDESKALSKAIRRTFGREALIQQCQIQKARNIMERLPKATHAAVRRVLRQAWELDDAEKVDLQSARRLEHDAPGVSVGILESLDEILTVTRLGLRKNFVARSPAPTS